jgi:hypothetical protein
LTVIQGAGSNRLAFSVLKEVGVRSSCLSSTACQGTGERIGWLRGIKGKSKEVVMRFAKSFATIGLLGLLVGSAPAADLSKIPRTIAKEPVYKSKPKYCLVVFGPEAKKRMWNVLDGDVLYVDKNGNGDLTEKGKSLSFTNQPLNVSDPTYLWIPLPFVLKSCLSMNKGNQQISPWFQVVQSSARTCHFDSLSTRVGWFRR